MKQCSKAALQAAIEAGKQAGLPAGELVKAEELLKKEELKALSFDLLAARLLTIGISSKSIGFE